MRRESCCSSSDVGIHSCIPIAPDVFWRENQLGIPRVSQVLPRFLKGKSRGPNLGVFRRHGWYHWSSLVGWLCWFHGKSHRQKWDENWGVPPLWLRKPPHDDIKHKDYTLPYLITISHKLSQTSSCGWFFLSLQFPVSHWIWMVSLIHQWGSALHRVMTQSPKWPRQRTKPVALGIACMARRSREIVGWQITFL